MRLTSGTVYSHIFRQVLFIRIQLKCLYIFIRRLLMRICFHCEDMDQHLNYLGETPDLRLITVTLQEIFFLPLKPQGFWHSPRNILNIFIIIVYRWHFPCVYLYVLCFFSLFSFILHPFYTICGLQGWSQVWTLRSTSRWIHLYPLGHTVRRGWFHPQKVLVSNTRICIYKGKQYSEKSNWMSVFKILKLFC